MEQPIYVYYILHDYNQNHKRYVRSVDWSQIHGKNQSAAKLVGCKGQKRYVTDSKNVTLEQNGLMNPCGLMSWSYFNDTFTDFKVSPVSQLLTVHLYVSCLKHLFLRWLW